MTYQIVYSSESSTPMQPDDLEEILEHARTNNAMRGITGALVYVEGVFLQVLEGDEVKLKDLMGRIFKDLRHETVSIFREGEVPFTTFSGWNMAYVSATPEEVANWAGLGKTTNTSEILDEIRGDPSRVAEISQSILSILAAKRSRDTDVD